MKRRSVLPGRALKRSTDCGAVIGCPATSQDKKQHFFQLLKESVFKPSPCQDTKPFSGTPRGVGVTTGRCGQFPNGFLPKRHRRPNPSSLHNSRYVKEKRESCTRPKRREGGRRPHIVRLSAAQNFVGSLPPSRAVCAKPSWPRARIGTYILQCKLHYKLQEKRNKLHGTFKGTIKTTQNYKSASSLGGRSQTQSGQICRVS